jgi:ABC-type spermidine/putrescine transport system permease subunit II
MVDKTVFVVFSNDFWLLLLLLLLLPLLIAVELSLGGGSPYTSTDKINKNKYTQMKQYKTQ